MHLFVTAGKVGQFLQTNGPKACLQEFGSRSRNPLFKITFSDKCSVDLRKMAIEVLAALGVEPDMQRKLCRWLQPGTKFFDLDARLQAFCGRLASLPLDLREFFFRTCLSNGANADSMIFLLAIFALPKVAYRDDIARLLDAQKNPEFLSIASSGIQDENAQQYFRVGCLDVLMLTHHPNLIPILLSGLKKSTLKYDDYLVDRIVDALNQINATGQEVENVLVEKFKEANPTDALGSLHGGLHRLTCRDDYGWDLDPIGRLLKAIGSIGGKNALVAMLRMFMASQSGVTNKQAIQTLDDDTKQAILKSANQDSMLFTVKMVGSMLEIYNRLMKTGEIKSAGDIEELEHFLLMHGYPTGKGR